MIKIRDFDSYFKQLVATLPAIEAHHLVAVDSHAVNRLKDKRGMHLILVIPNAQTTGDVGRPKDINTGMLFILEKAKIPSKYEDELDQYERTQNALLAIREAIFSSAEDHCYPFQYLQVPSVGIDPEYNVFGGWNGWSMVFTF
jgi:hypothetical protein